MIASVWMFCYCHDVRGGCKSCSCNVVVCCCGGVGGVSSSGESGSCGNVYG